VEWISKAWIDVPANIIIKLFLKCCLSNAEDGMDDDILWDDSELTDGDASTSEYDRLYSEVSQKKHWRSILIK
jgi:hypothetical protein